MSKATYNNCKTLITAGRYEYQNMMDKLALFLLVSLITQDELVELSGMMTPPNPVPDETPKEDTPQDDTPAA